MYRTPYKVAPSAISLSTYYKGYSRYVTDEEVKNNSMQILKMQYTYPYEILDFKDTEHNAAIQFENLVADTKTTVENLLDQFKMSCPDQLKRKLAERSKKEKKYVSQNKYSLDKYNISQAEFDTHFKEILMRFGYEEEGVWYCLIFNAIRRSL